MVDQDDEQYTEKIDVRLTPSQNIAVCGVDEASKATIEGILERNGLSGVDHLTALPRVSLNGEYQSSVYTRLYMTGAPFALWNRFRRVNAA